MTDIAAMMKQAQEMQARLAAAQQGLADQEVEGRAGGGMVSVTLNGKGEARTVHIDPTLMEEGEEAANVLEDLMVAAINDARRKVDEVAREQMAKVAGPLAAMMPKGFNPMG
ncbi:MAG: YbaB/EbfC family nucleoid-associated protein [Robiginitomaculum sp.]|nr:MAG: YbaB/EbfC family nucleoid-associated protein [Robiginitomaculum sp.]